jgi:predicted SAM-dependent methyltransferase
VAEKLRLHIGGRERKEGWKVLNIQPGEAVDYVGDIRELSQFETGSCEMVYASHVLEHVPQGDMVATLKGVKRVLAPQGRFLVSVPDLDTLSKMIVFPGLSTEQRIHVMRMMFGGQTDAHDYHFVGFSFDILASYLQAAGFASLQRVEQFGLFNDTSSYAPYGVPISLNVIAET